MVLVDVNRVNIVRDKSNVVKDVSLSLRPGEWTALLGPNGAGKSTLLSAICGLLPYEGSITIGGVELSSMSARAIANRVAVVRQSTPLLFDFSVHELVLLGLCPSRSALASFNKADFDRASKALEAVDLSGFENRSVLELSGGERQRVFLAQALLQEPDILILDEPTTHLDVHHQFAFLELVRDRVATGLCVLAAFHDLQLAARFADRVCVLDSGSNVAEGKPEVVVTEDLIRTVFRMDSRTEQSSEGHLSLYYKSKL